MAHMEEMAVDFSKLYPLNLIPERAKEYIVFLGGFPGSLTKD
jgi:hypothetical protein